eukprot:6485421-Amphidinium_carterae.1
MQGENQVGVARDLTTSGTWLTWRVIPAASGSNERARSAKTCVLGLEQGTTIQFGNTSNHTNLMIEVYSVCEALSNEFV